MMASMYGGLPPLSILSTLLPSLFGASSNSTTLSLCLRTLEDAACGISEGFKDFIVGFNESWADHRIMIILSGRMICEWCAFRSSGGKSGGGYWRSRGLVVIDSVWTGLIVAGPMDGSTDCANMDTIRLRWD
ncbi:hypothetical protein Tco_0620652 [Tanacetum coccineum]